ncbi:MAG: acetaldehyde dehydrogenase (acetylating) [Chloroflexota bacterium]
MPRVPVAIVGSGNIGTDLAVKLRRSAILEPVAMVGIDPASDGLRHARDWGLETSSDGVDWLLGSADRLGVKLVYEATSAKAHAASAHRYEAAGLVAVDLTPAAIGPAVVPSVNLDAESTAPNVNMITCGGQATIPIVAAVTGVAEVPYAEIVSTVASRSAGPGTRANIDEFTETTAGGLVSIGGAGMGKAIIILNPADPPIIMRNTVYCALRGSVDASIIEAAVAEMAARVASYVPGYEVVDVVFDEGPFETPGGTAERRVTILLRVTGKGDYLPTYAGNLDIMTAAAVRVGETLMAP